MKRFSRIYIEITNVCNLSCSFCIGNVRPPRFLGKEEFEQILQQIKPYTDYIYLHVLGEPLLHPQLGMFLDLADQAGMKTNITTNGTLLAQQQELLLKAPALRKVSVSLHSMEPGSSHVETDYLREVVSFVKEAAKKEIICDLRLWNLGAEDVDNENIFTSLCGLFELEEETRNAIRSKICESGNVVLAPKIYLGTALRFAWPSVDAKPTEAAVFCHGLRSQAAILCDGTVVPCCLDSRGDIALGNILETPLEEILKRERARKLYDGFSARRPSEELCRRCGYATRF